ncbi:efflux transporter outer membrane subunit [Solilutibacter tolerans]|uniref:Outer membrane protein, multidrug efflux system n=1 Tax=Solilutibacter tolerans TaxID=1604334 RepID=A0A1N6R468_9GAMM|nr:efflux transporter outer membrane subunit [Lysobacter tolerans]SIQ23613.1 outer membrane protein, multidrug efflux system [Lysobacter tolerans]
MNKTLGLALAIALAGTGCATLEPRLPEAQPQIPQSWPVPENGITPSATAVGEVGWRDVLVDPRLERVVAQALENNRDLRVAMLNVERARAQYRIQRAERVPAVGANVSMERTGGDAPTTDSFTASAGLASFELDLFGRVRNLSEAALQQYFAQEENRRAAQISLISTVANAWMALAADQSLLAIAEDTLRAQEASLRLTERRHELGAVSGLVLAQAQTQVETARADQARYRGQVEQDRHALDLLAGSPVPAGDLPQGFDDGLVAMTALPGGVPSDLLLRRPDIQASEHALRSANANIGAARAAFFPSIKLTGAAGSMSGEFSSLFDGGTRFWRFAPQISIPIFQGGALKANLGVATANRDIALANYEKAIQTGFREVADAISLSRTLADQRAAAERLLTAAQRAEQLSKARYDAGYDSYLTLLDAQRTRYAAQQGLVAARLAEQANRMTLYSAMGGGWDGGTATPTP